MVDAAVGRDVVVVLFPCVEYPCLHRARLVWSHKHSQIVMLGGNS